jgi:hypothetical protein
MDQIWRNTTEFQLLFNCSFYNVSDVPLSKRANVPLGIFATFITISETVNLIKKKVNKCIYSYKDALSALSGLNLAQSKGVLLQIDVHYGDT